MILLLLGWSPVGGVGFISLVRKEEGLIGFPFGGEARWARLEEGNNEWVRALVVCMCGWVGVIMFFGGTVGDPFFQCLSFFFFTICF